MYYTNSVHGGCQGPPTLFGGVTAQQPSLTDRASRLCHRFRATNFHFLQRTLSAVGNSYGTSHHYFTLALYPVARGLVDGLRKEPHMHYSAPTLAPLADSKLLHKAPDT
jgi:hypothetical protein